MRGTQAFTLHLCRPSDTQPSASAGGAFCHASTCLRQHPICYWNSNCISSLLLGRVPTLPSEANANNLHDMSLNEFSLPQPFHLSRMYGPHGNSLHVHEYVHISVYVCMYEQVRLYMQIYIYICVFIYICIYKRNYTYVYGNVNTHMYIYIYSCKHINIYIYASVIPARGGKEVALGFLLFSHL